ncbi:MAG TPA: ABC transporter ATP-binding protein [Terriglobales bacterium]|nr:ABC transporter ATP-binding protein [Terriglobales bacterium]
MWSQQTVEVDAKAGNLIPRPQNFTSATLLRVRGLCVEFRAGSGPVRALENLEFELAPGESLGVLGESGSGKSTLALALLRLLPTHARVSGDIQFRGQDLLNASARELRAMRGAGIALISQEPALALNPVLTIRRQIADVLAAHESVNAQQQRERVMEALRQVGLPEPERIARAYPHQLSGGQRQRAAIAQALVCRPALLIADEPLSSLDTATQAEVLELFRQLKTELGLSMIFISHNAGVFSSLCERALVLRSGRAVALTTLTQLAESDDPYGRGLLFPEIALSAGGHIPVPQPATGAPLLELKGVSKRFVQQKVFSRKKFGVSALEQVDLQVAEGETLAVIGRSGSGKSTLARCIAGFETADSGEIVFEGRRREFTPRIQVIFQDAGTAINPRFTAAEVIGEPLDIASKYDPFERRKRVLDLMEEVGLDPGWHNRPSHQFSGGQRQRMAMARALAAAPKLLLLDEPFSGLDLPLQAQMLRLLLDLQVRHGLTCVWIGHDLSFLSFFANEVVIMDGGRIVERTTPERLRSSVNPGTRLLVEAGERLHAPGLEAVS